MSSVNDVLHFWFGAPGTAIRGTFREAWFKKDPAFDDEIRRHFLGTTEAAARGELDRWQSDREGALALVILLDQFPFREDPVQALTRSLETIAMLDEACARVDLAKLATAQGNQDALAVQALYWNALLGTDRFAV